METGQTREVNHDDEHKKLDTGEDRICGMKCCDLKSQSSKVEQLMSAITYGRDIFTRESIGGVRNE
jgi:hypothetical protein